MFLKLSPIGADALPPQCHPLKSTRFYILLVVTVAAVAFRCDGALNAEKVRSTVPIMIDTVFHSSSLIVNFEMKILDRSLASFAPQDEAEVAIKNLLEGIKSKDSEKVFPLLRANEGFSSVENVNKFVMAYHDTFPLDQATIVAEVPLDNRRMFVWQVKSTGKQWTKDTWVRRQFTMIETNGTFVCDNEDQPVLTFLLDDILQQTPNHPELFKLPGKSPLKYSLPISTRNHAVTLEFDGFACDVDITAPELMLTNEVVRFYINAYRVLTNATASDFGKFYEKLTPSSRDRIRSGFEELYRSAQAISLLRQDASSRRVEFVMNADPIYIVFFENFGVLRHEYVVRSADSFFIANLNYEGFLDRVLKQSAVTGAIASMK